MKCLHVIMKMALHTSSRCILLVFKVNIGYDVMLETMHTWDKHLKIMWLQPTEFCLNFVWKTVVSAIDLGMNCAFFNILKVVFLLLESFYLLIFCLTD